MLFFIGNNQLKTPPRWHLNTSHVILYHNTPEQIEADIPIFKYISCYSLSHGRRRKRKPGLQFKYISCYSLSGQTERQWKEQP